MTDQKVVELPNFITVRDLADTLGVSPINIIKELMTSGIMANINQEIDFDTAAIVVEELGFEAVPFVEESEEEFSEDTRPEWRKIVAAERKVDLQTRPPVVAMLGHVDHGKTSLLDYIRQESVQAREAGGITQHIGAYQANYDGNRITFLDTPGHAAFTAMRVRGAQVTDIVILVVAADDGVMPQTKEAAAHARAAKVPIIVAMNKIDLNSANPPKVKQQLVDIGLVPDEWDGDTMVIPVSAKQGWGIDELLEAILLVSEDIEPKANPKASATGTVLEARMQKGRGVMTTLLVQNGTLKQGQTLLVGKCYGRIKSMYDFNGKRIKVARPSTPVSVSGLNAMPQVGDQFTVVSSEKEARKLVADLETHEMSDDYVASTRTGVSLDDFFSSIQGTDKRVLNLIVKADVQGSLAPIVDTLEELGNNEISVEILHAATGNVTENDVMLASASGAIVLGFNVSVDSSARVAASSEGVDIRMYDVIYKLFEDVEKALTGLLTPKTKEVVIGRAEIRQVFRIRNVGNIAGCYMDVGEARRNAYARVVRHSRLLHSGPVQSLKRMQDNVRTVRAGFEFGVNVEGWSDYRPGDQLEFFVKEKVEPSL